MDKRIDFLTQQYDIRSPEGYTNLIRFMEESFLNNSLEHNNVKKIAHQIKSGFEKINPFVQASTALICPTCKNVCCIRKHGFYNFEDFIYNFALNKSLPATRFEGNDNDMCQFLSVNGCIIERPFRPSGCNWYFCNSLLDHMETLPEYQDFDDEIGDIAALWLQMVEEFSRTITFSAK